MIDIYDLGRFIVVQATLLSAGSSMCLVLFRSCFPLTVLPDGNDVGAVICTKSFALTFSRKWITTIFSLAKFETNLLQKIDCSGSFHGIEAEVIFVHIVRKLTPMSETPKINVSPA
jgi:hypothetical protein